MQSMVLHSYYALYPLIHIYMQFKIDVSNGGILCENMHRPGDGDQDLHLYYFDLEGLVRDMFADPMVEGKQHLYFKADIAPSGKRRFTDAHTCLAFEEAARKIGPGVAIYSLVLFIDGTHQWKNVHVCPVYISTLNNAKEIAKAAIIAEGFALFPVYKVLTSTLKGKEKSYRTKQVCCIIKLFFPLLLH